LYSGALDVAHLRRYAGQELYMFGCHVKYLFVGLVLGLGGCGDNNDPGRECGPGTYEADGECIAVDPNDATAPVTTAAPGPGRMRAMPPLVVLTTNEPATIYYTRDGSSPTTSSPSGTSAALIMGLADGDVVRYFAVDPAGNSEAVQSLAYTLDVAGPPPVSAFALTQAVAAVTLTWTNPADPNFQGVVVAAGINGGFPVWSPVPGRIYTAGEVLPGGEKVVFVGSAATASDTITELGFKAYGAWAFDDVGNYSDASLGPVAGLTAPLTGQTTTLSVDLTSQVVTVGTQPTALSLAATATYDDANDTLSITLRATNKINRPIFNLKALTTSLNEGTQGGPNLGGTPMTDFGRKSLRSRTSREATIRLSGITGATDPILLDLTFADAPMLITRNAVADAVTGASTGVQINGRPGSKPSVDPLGRYMAIGGRNAMVSLIDLATHAPSFVDLGSASSFASTSTTTPAFTTTKMYLAINDGAHLMGGIGDGNGPGAGNTVRVAEIDLRTLELLREVTLTSAISDGPLAQGGIHLSPDGRTLAIPVRRSAGNQLWLVDVGTFLPIDADAGTTGVQPVALSPAGRPVEGAWSATSASFFVGYHNRDAQNYGHDASPGDGTTPPVIDVVNTATFVVSQLVPANGGLMAMQLDVHAGKLYYVSSNNNDAPSELTVFDLAGGQVDVDVGLSRPSGLAFDPSGTRYYVVDNNCATKVVDATTNAVISTVNLCARRHGVTITPF
jgi:hypothetical protein